jgi:glycosyltransferase involved in cell wall biosynthesis
MKILFLSHKFYPDIGGIEVNSEILATGFHEAGHEIKLITWTKEAGSKSFPFEVVRNPGLKTLLNHHYRADIIFENNPCLRLAWPRLITRKPYIVAIRTWISRIDGKTGIQDIIKKYWLRNAAGVIAISQAVKDKTWSSAVVIGNPYRADQFRIMPDIERNKKFVFLGRLVSDKGAEMAVSALHKLKYAGAGNAIPEYKPTLTIIGDGEERSSLEKQVHNLGMTGSVFFTGPLSGDALVRSLNEHEYLLVPSLWEEPFGNVALEGMACGCIPIVSDGGGLPDAAGDAGMVFLRGNIDDLVSTIISVENSPVIKDDLLQAAPAHLAAHHPAVIAKKYLAVVNAAFKRALV